MKTPVLFLASAVLAFHSPLGFAVVVGEDGKVIENPTNPIDSKYTKSQVNGNTVYTSTEKVLDSNGKPQDVTSTIVTGPHATPFNSDGSFKRTMENGNTVYTKPDGSQIVVHGDDSHAPAPKREQPALSPNQRCGDMVARLYRGMDSYLANLKKEITRLQQQRLDYNANLKKNWAGSTAKKQPHGASTSDFDGVLELIASIEKSPLPLDKAQLDPGNSMLRSNKEMVTRYQFTHPGDASSVPSRTSDPRQLGQFLCGTANEKEINIKRTDGSLPSTVKAKFTLQPEFAYLDDRLSFLSQELANATDRVADTKPGVDPQAYRRELFKGLNQVRSWIKGVQQSPEVSSIYKSQSDGL